jgi:alpha-beta hydrolase superfamily lysophospholipase
MAQVQPAKAWVAELLSGLAVASGVGYLAASYSVSRWLTKPTPAKLDRNPGQLGLPWEPLTCTTEDGLRLAGWSVTPGSPRATVALFHGMRGNRARLLPRVDFLARAGYRCVAFDHRAHGESDGKRTSFGFYEARDVAAVLDFVRHNWPGQPCVAHGISMGAAAVCFAGRRIIKPDAVILESLYHDLASAFRNRLTNSYPPWFRKFCPGIVWVTQRRMAMRLEDIAPAEHIGNLAPAPILLLTGTDDPHAPPEEALRLYDRCGDPREIWFVPGAGHKNVYEAGGSDYEQRILDFLRRRAA